MFRFNLSLGNFSAKYSNETMKLLLFELFAEYKKMSVLRDFNFNDMLKGESENPVHRKIELMMPFYIIKRLV